MKKNLIKKIIMIIIGSIVSAFGITLAINAGFGGATLAVLWQGVSKTFHVSLGMASFIVAIIMIVAVLFYDRSQIFVGTVLYQVIYSTMVDIFGKVVVYTPYNWVNLIFMLAGITIFAIGTGIYSCTDMGRDSYEAVTFSINHRTNWQIRYIRMISDAVVVILGVILGGKFGICTIATVLLSGPIIQKTVKSIHKI